MAEERVRLTRPTSSGENILHPETEVAQITDFEEGVQQVASGLSITSVPMVDDYSYRPELFKVVTSGTYAYKGIIIPAGLRVMVNGRYYEAVNDTEVDIPSTITAANRKGKDLYIYAVENPDTSSTTPVFVISMDSTYPSGYTADTSRKIGGFHCLCADVGTKAYTGSSHPLYNRVAGDILPASRWDLVHRPNSSPEGMVYDEASNIWVDIYLSSLSGSGASGKLLSVYNAATTDGGSTSKFHWYKYVEYFARTKKRLPWQSEFMQFSLGSNQGTNIKGSADVTNTGGHEDTNSKRMISNIGVEDCCGFLDQWGLDRGGSSTTGTSWANAADANDDNGASGYGQHYAAPNCILLGGDWTNGACCGSRFSRWDRGPLYLHSVVGARGVSSPLNP